MTVKEFASLADFKIVSCPDGERVVSGAYAGDLLSWVMGRAKADSAWITIMSNINVIAVASLADVSCVILAEGVIPEEEIIKTVEAKGINILSSALPIYESAVKISGMI